MYLVRIMDRLISLSEVVRDAKPQFVSLLNKSILLRQKYLDFYGTEDVRPEYFDREFQLNVWLLTQFDNFLEIVEHNERITRYVEFTPQMGSVFLNQYDTINRTCYCTRVMFDVDNFLANIAKNINVVNTNYAPMVNAFTKLGLSEQQRRTLLAPAAFRNSLHNNGYYQRGEEFDLTLGAITWHFRLGKRVEDFTWSNMYVVFDELFNALEAIINLSEVQKVPNIPHNSMTYHDTQ